MIFKLIDNIFGTKSDTGKHKTYHKVKYAYHGLRCYNRGLNKSERKVKNTLSHELNLKKYFIFNNLTLQKVDGSSQIDHVVVSPYGVFVIETKDYSGWIFGSKEGKVWTQVLPGGNKNTFQNPIRQNFSHIKTLQKHLPFIQTSSFKTVIAFTRHSQFKTIKPHEVKYINEVASYINEFDIQIIGRSAYFMAIGKLSQLCQSIDISPNEHIKNLNTSHNASKK